MSDHHHVTFVNTTQADEDFFKQYFMDGVVAVTYLRHSTEDWTSAIVQLPAETTVLSVDHTVPVNEDMLKKLPNLKAVVTRSTGYNHIDLNIAAQKGIVVSNVPSYGEHTVAEFAFTLLLALTRKLRSAIKQIESGDMDYSQLQGTDLAGKTMGVIGTGKIGSNTLRIAHGFDMKLLGYDPYPNQQLVSNYDVKYVSLVDLLRQSDVVSLHAPSTPDNIHIIDSEALRLMKPSALLINTARGDLVDTGALVEALSEAQIAGAGLDVIEGENLLDIDEEMKFINSRPHKRELVLAADQAILLRMPNVICTPHNAFNTVGALERIRQTTAENIESFMSGTIKNEVRLRP